MIRSTWITPFLLPLVAAPLVLADSDLQVSPNGHYLTKSDGQPWFYLGDTGWLLAHRQTREQVDQYLDDRAAKGFSVIQIMGLAEVFTGMTPTNAYGQTALLNNNPSTPNDDYWEHVDYILNKAAEKGMYVALAPTWGNYVHDDNARIFNETNAYDYGLYLGQRYKDQTNIIWMLGGDRPATGDEAVWRAMAKGIAIGVAGTEDYSKSMMTYHPKWEKDGKSSDWFHNDAWLDFNTLQSSHASRNRDNYTGIRSDYNLQPPKPTMDSEPRYEGHPVNAKPENGYFEAYDVRQAAYWALFAGAHGHTYGHNAIWQFYQDGRTPLIAPLVEWDEALDAEGGNDMKHVRDLMESRPMLSRVPDQTLIVGGQPDFSGNHIQATRDADGSYAFIYTAGGVPVTVNLNRLTGSEVRAWWYNPRDGSVIEIGTYARSGNRTFTPPTPADVGNDWVLVLDDPSKGYVKPGTFFTKRSNANQDPLFIKGVNLNGNAVVINHNRWDSYEDALANWLEVNPSATVNTSALVLAQHAYGTDEWHLLNTSVAADDLALEIELDPGSYRVVLYAATNEDGSLPDFNIVIEGSNIASGGWTTTGQLASRSIQASIDDGVLDIVLQGVSGDASLSGVAVFAIPEPGTLVLLAAAAAPACLRPSRHRARASS